MLGDGYGGQSFRLMASLFCVFLAAACENKPLSPQFDSEPPRLEPHRGKSEFEAALECMDELFLMSGIRDIAITSTDFSDDKGKAYSGSKDMLISALSRMSAKSGAFTFVDYGQNQTDVFAFQKLLGFPEEFRVPTYFLRGALGLSARDGPPAPAAGPSGAEIDALAKRSVSLDMNLGRLVSRQIVPGMSSSQTLFMTDRLAAPYVDAKIRTDEAEFQLSFARDKAVHRAVRALIQLAAIETLGKFAKVPFRECLQADGKGAERIARAIASFRALSEAERVAFAQAALREAGHYAGRVSGEIDQELRDAITLYQAEHQLAASGQVDFNLYWVLLGEVAAGPEDRPNVAPSSRARAAVPTKLPKVGVARPDARPFAGSPARLIPLPKLIPPSKKTLRVDLVSARGPAPVYRPGEALEMRITTSGPAYLYCFYRDAQGKVFRIFPNRFQSDAFVAENKQIDLPGRDTPFDIVFEQPRSREEVMCLASALEIGLVLPKELKVSDLEPLPVKTLSAVVQAFKKIDHDGLALARLPIKVTE